MFKRTRSSTSSLHAGREDDEFLIKGIFFNEETSEQINHLFKLIDKNSDGTLSKEDFHVFDSTLTSKQAEKWHELRDNFDANCDGVITLEEFRNGFKHLALNRPAFVDMLPPESTKLRDWFDEFELRTNNAVKVLIDEIVVWLQQ